jgi:hypothetical protein
VDEARIGVGLGATARSGGDGRRAVRLGGAGRQQGAATAGLGTLLAGGALAAFASIEEAGARRRRRRRRTTVYETETASAGNGGVADASANGGAVAIGDINSGSNS